MMEASCTSDTPANFYQTTQHNIPDYSHLKIPYLLWNLEAHYCIYKSSSLQHIPSQLNAVYVFRTCFFKIPIYFFLFTSRHFQIFVLKHPQSVFIPRNKRPGFTPTQSRAALDAQITCSLYETVRNSVYLTARLPANYHKNILYFLKILSVGCNTCHDT
jgi:hypothetical protein